MLFSNLLIFVSVVLAIPSVDPQVEAIDVAKRIVWKAKGDSNAGEVRHSDQEKNDPNNFVFPDEVRHSQQEKNDPDNFVFPDDVEAAKERIRAAESKAKDQQEQEQPKIEVQQGSKDPNKKWKYANNGSLCLDFRYLDAEEIPEECLKAVYCSDGAFSNIGCRNIFFDYVNKSELLETFKEQDCIRRAICKKGEVDQEPLE